MCTASGGICLFIQQLAWCIYGFIKIFLEPKAEVSSLGVGKSLGEFVGMGHC